MELHHLQTFVVVAEEASITRAAKRLYTTPSSISVHIKTLEDELNVQLFTRTSRGMQITDKGQILLEKALLTLQSVNNLVNHATDMQDYLMGDVRIGVNAPIGLLGIPQLITRLKNDSEGITLKLQHLSSAHVIENVLKGNSDIGFAYSVPENKELNRHFLADMRLSIAAPIAWQENLQDATWEKLAQFPWVCNEYHCPFQAMIDEVFEGLKLSPKKIIQTNDEASKADLVVKGIGLSLLETMEAEKLVQQEKVLIIPNIEFSCPLYMISLSHRQYDPLIACVVEHIKTIWQDSIGQ